MEKESVVSHWSRHNRSY